MIGISPTLFERFDCVVMLTWSDWFREMRSNRYHYATRFAKHRPVLFVQPDAAENQLSVEKVEGHNIWVVHVGASYGAEEFMQLGQSLADFGFSRPLLWIYNGFFGNLAARIASELKVYHATEDYFCSDFNGSKSVSDAVRHTISICDALVAVSDGVLESYRVNTSAPIPSIVLANGVDFQFWKNELLEVATKPIAVYQGGISRKLDFPLLHALAEKNRDWTFRFYGRIFECEDLAANLFKLPNVDYRGQVDLDKLREELREASVGLIPFVQNDWIVNRSFPLKTFEYLAAGIPVVSVPIQALEQIQAPVHWARSAAEFSIGLELAMTERKNLARLAELVKTASRHDYDGKFESLLSFLSGLVRPASVPNTPIQWLRLHGGNGDASRPQDTLRWIDCAIDSNSELPVDLFQDVQGLLIEPTAQMVLLENANLAKLVRNFVGAKIWGPTDLETLIRAQQNIRGSSGGQDSTKAYVTFERGRPTRAFFFTERIGFDESLRRVTLQPVPFYFESTLTSLRRASQSPHSVTQRIGLKASLRLLFESLGLFLSALNRFLAKRLLP
jgi:glycosyltransferase involved in cell wall biosynthesis